MAISQRKAEKSDSCSVHKAACLQLILYMVCQICKEIDSNASEGMDLLE